MLWKVLLGYLPIARHTEFNAIQGEKRAAYLSHRQNLLEVDDGGVRERTGAGGPIDEAEVERRRGLLEVLRSEVETLGGSRELFQNADMCNSLVALLFIYAHLNPDIRYVQGMNDIAAVIMHVFSVGSESLEAEADAFWCFNGLMSEIRERFLQTVDETSSGIHKLVGTSGSLLSKYDPELANHLATCDLEPGIFALRWFTLLFARDMTLPEVVRLWDAQIAGARGFELCGHFCMSLVMGCREDLLSTANVMVMAEVLQAAPRKDAVDANLRRAWAICSLERRPQMPPFPQLTATDVVQEVAGAFFSGLFNRF